MAKGDYYDSPKKGLQAISGADSEGLKIEY
jgi:hypothetical protein